MTFKLSDHDSVAHRYIAELRNVHVQKDRMRFRRNMERLGEVLGYEISKKLDYEDIEVETPLGIAKSRVAAKRVVIASILRAGLPFHQGLLNYFDDADNAFVSAYRQHHKDGTFEINIQYVSCPNLEDCILIVADPMLATGASMNLAIKTLIENGKPSEIHMVTAIASTYGLEYIRRMHPDIHLWMGDLDDELTAKSYIVPGLGDAGDLAYGSKLQE